MKINKSFLKLIAALFILVFHLWIPISSSIIEAFILKIGYIGVDIFFLVSAYSLSDKDISYKEFIKNRFFNIYIKFLLFVIFAAVIKGYSFLRVVKIISLAEFFIKGGGSFLWFVPAILLFYILYPLFIKWNNSYKVALIILFWFALSYLLDVFFNYSDIFIFTNRIPVILIGYLLKKYKIPYWTSFIGIIPGISLLYFYGYNYKLNVPFSDIYYVFGVLCVVGICGVSVLVGDNKIIKRLSTCTFELYAFQMIIGAKITNILYKTTQNALGTNILMIAVLFGLSFAFAWGYEVILTHIKGLLKNKI